MPTIAIIGTTGFIGGMLLRTLCARKRRPRIIALDLAPPSGEHGPYEFVRCDLTAPHAGRALAKLFQDTHCDVVIHAALHSQPKRNQEYAHELLSIGTMQVLHAVAASPVAKLILSSTTEVYGAFPDNPNFLTEAHPLRGGSISSFLRDKVDVERQVAHFAQQHPERHVIALRPCTILGPHIRNYKTHLLKQDVLCTVLGFDPQVQFVHENDVTRAYELAIRKSVSGCFNIVGDGVVPLSRALALIGKTQIPLPSPLLRSGTALLWHLHVQRTPPSHIDFLKYPCIADGQRAKHVLGFAPVFTLREVLFSFTQAHPHG